MAGGNNPSNPTNPGGAYTNAMTPQRPTAQAPTPSFGGMGMGGGNNPYSAYQQQLNSARPELAYSMMGGFGQTPQQSSLGMGMVQPQQMPQQSSLGMAANAFAPQMPQQTPLGMGMGQAFNALGPQSLSNLLNQPSQMPQQAQQIPVQYQQQLEAIRRAQMGTPMQPGQINGPQSMTPGLDRRIGNVSENIQNRAEKLQGQGMSYQDIANDPRMQKYQQRGQDLSEQRLNRVMNQQQGPAQANFSPANLGSLAGGLGGLMARR